MVILDNEVIGERGKFVDQKMLVPPSVAPFTLSAAKGLIFEILRLRLRMTALEVLLKT
jgi:hypothetical protein